MTRSVRKQTLASKMWYAVLGNLKFRVASLMVGTTLDVFQKFGEGMRKSMDYEDVIREMQALTGAYGKDLDFLNERAWKLGKIFGKSGVEAMTGVKQTADAFPDLLKNIPGLAAMTKEAMVLSTAAGTDMPKSVKTLNAVLNIFQKDATQAKSVINELTAGALLSNVMTDQLAETIIRAGGAATAVGISLPRFIALTNALGGSEIKAGKAGTAMNMMLVRMAARNIKVGDESRKLSAIIGDIKNKYEEAGDAGLGYLAKITGVRHVKALKAIIANIGKLDAWEKGVQGTNEAYRQSGVRLQTMRKELEKTGTVMSEKFWKIFENIEPSLVRLTRSFRQWIDSMSEEELAGYAAVLDGVVRTMEELFFWVKVLLAPFRGLAVVIGDIETRRNKLGGQLSEKYQLGWQMGVPPGPGLEKELEKFDLEITLFTEEKMFYYNSKVELDSTEEYLIIITTYDEDTGLESEKGLHEDDLPYKKILNELKPES